MTAPVAEILLPEQSLPAHFAPRPADFAASLLSLAEQRLAEAERRIAEQETRIRQLEDLAATDPMTGLMNRRGFEKFFEQEQARMRRYNSNGAYLLLIDLDHFKHLNDTHGHHAGDLCLQKVADVLQAHVRVLDGVVRFGGDEFAVLLTQTDGEKAADRIALIRTALENITVEYHGETLHVGASLGGAPVHADSAYNDVYRAADSRLYMDKHNRRHVK